MVGIIIFIIASIVFLTTIIWSICDKNGNENSIKVGGTIITAALILMGFICFTSPSSMHYRQTVRPSLDDINDGYASIDSVGVINGITQYEIHWIGSQTGKREQ